MPKAGTKAKGQVKNSRNVRVAFGVIPEWKSLVLPGMDAYRVNVVPKSRGGERSKRYIGNRSGRSSEG